MNNKIFSFGRNKLVATIGIALLSTVALADDSDVVDYRKRVMTALSEQLAAVQMILAHKAPAVDIVAQCEALALTAKVVKSAFEPKVVDGAARPEIWTQWADFSRQIDALNAATLELAKTAKSDPLASTEAKATAIECKGCHAKYTTLKP